MGFPWVADRFQALIAVAFLVLAIGVIVFRRVMAHEMKSGLLSMDAAEMLPVSPRGSLENNRISVSPTAATGGQSGAWGDFDKLFETPVEDLKKLTIIPKDIDPQGLFKPLPAPQYLQGPPAAQQEVIPEPGDDIIYFVDHARGPIEKRYEAEFLRLERDLASQVALEEGTEHVDALQRHINALSTMNTATPAPFIVSTPGIAGAAGPSVSTERLVDSILEPIHEQERAAVEKDRENFEVVAADLEHNKKRSRNTHEGLPYEQLVY